MGVFVFMPCEGPKLWSRMMLLRPAAIVFFTGYGLQKLGYGIKTKQKTWVILGALWLALAVGILICFFKDIIG